MMKPVRWDDITEDMMPFPVREPRGTRERRVPAPAPVAGTEVTVRLNASQHTMLVGLVTGIAQGMGAECRSQWDALLLRLKGSR